MKEPSTDKIPAWLPKGRISKKPIPIVRPNFSPAYLDFERGIRVGNLEPNQRITQILKAHLQDRHGTPFITDRWGRGVYWQWICWVPVAARKAKPISSHYNFGTAKFFISLDQDDLTFEAGMQVEGAPTRAGAEVRMEKDWDFHAMVRGLRRGQALAAEVERLVTQDGFTVRAGIFDHRVELIADNYKGPAPLVRACRSIPADGWGAFQLCYVFKKDEIEGLTGGDIVATIEAVFDELAAAMNAVLTVPCLKVADRPGPGDESR